MWGIVNRQTNIFQLLCKNYNILEYLSNRVILLEYQFLSASTWVINFTPVHHLYFLLIVCSMHSSCFCWWIRKVGSSYIPNHHTILPYTGLKNSWIYIDYCILWVYYFSSKWKLVNACTSLLVEPLAAVHTVIHIVCQSYVMCTSLYDYCVYDIMT